MATFRLPAVAGALVCGASLGLPAAAGGGDRLVAAVASNFAAPARAIAREFEAASGHRVTLVPGSTGKHHAQIVNGAPFDVFLAADREHPERLAASGLALPGRFTYALGRLALWSRHPTMVDAEGRVLAAGSFRRLAIAQPRLAPYGRAARQALERLGLWAQLEPRLVRGENVGHAFHFAASGAAELAFVALSQVLEAERRGLPRGSVWIVPPEFYDPIEQQAVLLAGNDRAAAFFGFLSSPRVRAIVAEYGYALP